MYVLNEIIVLSMVFAIMTFIASDAERKKGSASHKLRHLKNWICVLGGIHIALLIGVCSFALEFSFILLSIPSVLFFGATLIVVFDLVDYYF